ncbi:MAG: fibronectin type III domain-containing protein, partial [Bacteroidota bacterium]
NPFIDHPEYVNYINFADLTKLTPSYSTEPTNQPTAAATGTISNTSLTVSWTSSVAGAQAPSGYLVEIYNSNDYFIPIDGSAYSDDTNLSDTKGVVNVAAGTSSVSFTGLNPSTTYYIRLYPYNGSGTSINYKIDGTIQAVTGTTTSGAVTYATEPANHPTNLTAGTVASSSIGLTWTKSSAGAQAPSGYLLMANTTGTFTSPSDGTAYTDDANLSDNTAVVNLDSSAASYSFSSLSGSTAYYFKLFPYNGTGSQRNYKTDGIPAAVSATTLTLMSAEPTNYPTSFNQGTITSSSIQLTWVASAAGTQAPTGYLLIGSTSNSITVPTDGTVYSDDTALSDNYAVVNLDALTTTYTFTSLPAATTYFFKIFPYSGTGASRNYKTDGAPPNQSGLTSGAGVAAPAVVVNEYFNAANKNLEWVELLVLQDNLDMRGMKLQDYSSGGTVQSGAAVTFTTNALWSSVAKGTFVVVLGNANVQTEDTEPNDKVVIIRNNNTTYFTGGTGFDISATADALEILTSGGTHIHSLSNGSKPGAIATIPSPTANYGSTLVGASFRFTGVTSGSDFNSDAKTSNGTSATQGAANDASETSYISSILPVELVSFTGNALNGAVTLKWETATEVNNYGFEIELRAIDNGQLTMDNWSRIGFVEGSGASNSPKEYSFIDRTAKGTSVYRLKQIDRDGKFEYSPEVSITVPDIPQQYSLMQNYPNPFNPSTTIRFTLAAPDHVTLKIFNALGQSVETILDGPLQAGSHYVVYNASALSSGTYFYTLTAGKFSSAKSFVLMK